MNYDPVVNKALDDARLITGSIMPRYLARAIPPVGRRRAHLDTVALVVLVEIMGAYRFPPGRRPYWTGPAFAINRDDLAYISSCPVTDISRVLSHLERCGFIRRWLETHVNSEGEVAGKRSLVVPNFAAIKKALSKAERHANAEEPLKDTQAILEGHFSPNAVRHKTDAERDHGGAARRGRAETGNSEHEASGNRVVERGGEAVTPTGKALGPALSAAAAAATGGPGQPRTTFGLAGSTKPYDAAREAKQFANLFVAMADRSGLAIGITVSATQLKRVTSYFACVRLTGAFVASIAAKALHYGASDPSTYPESASVTEPLQFVYSMARIQREFPKFNQFPESILRRLLLFFTPTELEAHGIPYRLGVLDDLSPQVLNALWMHTPSTPTFYERRALQVPADFSGPVVNGGRRTQSAQTN